MTLLFVILVVVSESVGFVGAAADSFLRTYSQPGRLVGNVTTSQAVQ